ncbi:hypothetical protein CapIbe_021680 [Capra ibex]
MNCLVVAMCQLCSEFILLSSTGQENVTVKGISLSFQVVRIIYLLNGWGKEFWRSARGWDWLGGSSLITFIQPLRKRGSPK